MDDTKYTLTEHLGELRVRLLKSVLAIILTSGVALFFADRLLSAAIAPLRQVLNQKNRVETVVVAPDAQHRAALVGRVSEDPRVSIRGDFASLSEAVAMSRDLATGRLPIDLLVVSSAATSSLADDALDTLDPAPLVAYLVRDPRDPKAALLALDGGAVLVDPPRKAALARVVRRAAAAAGKTSSNDKLVVLSPVEPFFAYLKIALVVGLFLACPIWLYQAWRFIAPGLYDREKGVVLPVVLSASLLFIGGGAFAYYGFFPVLFDVLINQLMPADLSGAFTVDNYLMLMLMTTLAFGLIFELPLAIALLSVLGFVSKVVLVRFRKYFIIAAFVVGGILTPADPISQSMMAVPLVLFYEVGIVLVGFIEKRRERRLALAAGPQEP